MAAMKILVIVEDELEMRRVVRMLLRRDQRLEILGEAATADEAVALAASMQPGLIILDHFIEGPVMGLEAAPALKAAAPEAKILLFTAYDMAALARQEPAVDAYLRKDNLTELLGTVQRLLGLQPLVA
jgi:DNA-binding NarL/FixJ family response regulator